MWIVVVVVFVSVSNESNKTKKNGGRNGQNRVRHELDAQGLVPLPAATCFYCRKSCKKAPLIACDYCPLFFHQVCSTNYRTARVHFSLSVLRYMSNCVICQNQTRYYTNDEYSRFRSVCSTNYYFVFHFSSKFVQIGLFRSTVDGFANDTLDVSKSSGTIYCKCNSEFKSNAAQKIAELSPNKIIFEKKNRIGNW